MGSVFNNYGIVCQREGSEESHLNASQILRFAQNDSTVRKGYFLLEIVFR
jgi:hypothetical protein